MNKEAVKAVEAELEKAAMNPMLATSLLGAGIGGLGTGLASSSVKRDYETRKQRRARILKDMMLGTALGGATGAAGYAGVDYLSRPTPVIDGHSTGGFGGLVRGLTRPAAEHPIAAGTAGTGWALFDKFWRRPRVDAVGLAKTLGMEAPKGKALFAPFRAGRLVDTLRGADVNQFTGILAGADVKSLPQAAQVHKLAEKFKAQSRLYRQLKGVGANPMAIAAAKESMSKTGKNLAKLIKTPTFKQTVKGIPITLRHPVKNFNNWRATADAIREAHGVTPALKVRGGLALTGHRAATAGRFAQGFGPLLAGLLPWTAEKVTGIGHGGRGVYTRNADKALMDILKQTVGVGK